MLEANPTRLANRSQHVYQVRPRKDHRSVDLISDALPFGRLWYGEPNTLSNAIGYAKHRGRSLTLLFAFTMTLATCSRPHEHAGEFKEP